MIPKINSYVSNTCVFIRKLRKKTLLDEITLKKGSSKQHLKTMIQKYPSEGSRIHQAKTMKMTLERCLS